jgi:hypothetical protein
MWNRRNVEFAVCVYCVHLGAFPILSKKIQKRPTTSTTVTSLGSGGEVDGGDEQTLQQTYSPKGKCKMRSKFWWLTGFAIRMTYRISLRSSSIWEPRHPLLKVFDSLKFIAEHFVIKRNIDRFLIEFKITQHLFECYLKEKPKTPQVNSRRKIQEA